MVIVDLKKCVGCGTCQIVCPREAIYAWTQARVDRTRCTDCYEGLHYFEKNTPLSDRMIIRDTTRTLWQRACIESCPQEALICE